MHCVTGEFGNNAGQLCSLCAPRCVVCTGATALLCEECDPALAYRETATNVCVQCTSTQYGDDAAQQCKECDATCKTCRGPGPFQCTSCDITKSYWLKEKMQCVQCVQGQFGDDATRQCIYCPNLCLVCTGANIQDCTLCDVTKAYKQTATNLCFPCPLSHYVPFHFLLKCPGSPGTYCLLFLIFSFISEINVKQRRHNHFPR